MANLTQVYADGVLVRQHYSPTAPHHPDHGRIDWFENGQYSKTTYDHAVELADPRPHPSPFPDSHEVPAAPEGAAGVDATRVCTNRMQTDIDLLTNLGLTGDCHAPDEYGTTGPCPQRVCGMTQMHALYRNRHRLLHDDCLTAVDDQYQTFLGTIAEYNCTAGQLPLTTGCAADAPVVIADGNRLELNPDAFSCGGAPSDDVAQGMGNLWQPIAQSFARY